MLQLVRLQFLLKVTVLRIGLAIQTGIADLGPDGITFHFYDQKAVGSTTLPRPKVHPVCFAIAHSAGSTL